jgi:hypothetical protein
MVLGETGVRDVDLILAFGKEQHERTAQVMANVKRIVAISPAFDGSCCYQKNCFCEKIHETVKIAHKYVFERVSREADAFEERDRVFTAIMRRLLRTGQHWHDDCHAHEQFRAVRKLFRECRDCQHSQDGCETCEKRLENIETCSAEDSSEDSEDSEHSTEYCSEDSFEEYSDDSFDSCENHVASSCWICSEIDQVDDEDEDYLLEIASIAKGPHVAKVHKKPKTKNDEHVDRTHKMILRLIKNGIACLFETPKLQQDCRLAAKKVRKLVDQIRTEDVDATQAKYDKMLKERLSAELAKTTDVHAKYLLNCICSHWTG